MCACGYIDDVSSGLRAADMVVELCADWRPPSQLKFLYHNLLHIYINIMCAYIVLYIIIILVRRGHKSKYSDKPRMYTNILYNVCSVSGVL